MMNLLERSFSSSKTKKGFTQALKESAKNQQGFSLIEILVALTLLGIAGTFVAGKIFDQLEEGRIQATRIQLQAFEANLKEFRRKCNFYPPETDGLNALIQKPSGKECKNYPPEGFLDDGVIPVDPWDTEYLYKLNGSKPEIISAGPDQEFETEDDVSSDAKKQR